MTTTKLICASALLLAAAPLATGCANFKVPGMPGGGGCDVDFTKPETVASASFGLDAEVEANVKATLQGAAELKAKALAVEGKVAAACGDLAKSLGGSVDGEAATKAEPACQAALKAYGDMMAKAQGNVQVSFDPPKCSVPIDAFKECAADCLGGVDAGKFDVECSGGSLSGSCSGECQGECVLEAGAECSGTCSGACTGQCEGEISGKCGGTCEGKCDGKESSGTCDGTCEGKCDGKMEGACSGKCDGGCDASCTVQAEGECKGTCKGGCSTAMEAPKCGGDVKPPSIDLKCQATCTAAMQTKLSCEAPKVNVTIDGAADASTAAELKTALATKFSGVVEVAVGMKDLPAQLSGSVTAISKNATASIQGLSGKLDGPALKATACLNAAVSAATEASASLKASVKASASVSTKVSAGGSASGSASGSAGG